jgi:hypothetical protein
MSSGFPDGNVPEALASGGYGALPTGIVASFNAMSTTNSPNSRNVAVASAARPIVNTSGYAQLPGGGPIDVPPTPGARQYTGMPPTNQKPTSSGCKCVFRAVCFHFLRLQRFHFQTARFRFDLSSKNTNTIYEC